MKTVARTTSATRQQQQRCAAGPSARVPAARMVTRASASPEAEAGAVTLSKRELLLSVAGLGVGSMLAPVVPQALADEGAAPYATFLGYATPPTSYGGYGGNANEPPKYTFEYPSGWKSDIPNKVEKGTQGIDGRVVNPRSKDQRAFVITLGRAGEDNKSFRLTDLDNTLSGFAGADYDLQDALSSATDKTTTKREVDGFTLYDYDIASPEYHYLASITVNQGKVFALFVRSPTKTFAANEEKLRHIISTFKLL